MPDVVRLMVRLIQWDTRIGRENAAARSTKLFSHLSRAETTNAKNSTGPRSENGASAVQGNALRDGLTAETVIDVLEETTMPEFRKRFALSTRRLSRSADNQDLANA